MDTYLIQIWSSDDEAKMRLLRSIKVESTELPSWDWCMDHGAKVGQHVRIYKLESHITL